MYRKIPHTSRMSRNIRFGLDIIGSTWSSGLLHHVRALRLRIASVPVEIRVRVSPVRMRTLRGESMAMGLTEPPHWTRWREALLLNDMTSSRVMTIDGGRETGCAPGV
jgi:hypothetical protein